MVADIGRTIGWGYGEVMDLPWSEIIEWHKTAGEILRDEARARRG